MKIEVIYEDKWIMVIAKTAGVVVNRADSVRTQTIQDWVEEYFGWKKESMGNIGVRKETDGDEYSQEVFVERSGVAHRLDKNTSGVMIVAKDPNTLVAIMRQFRERKIRKTYTAMVHGRIEPREGYWMMPIQRSTKNRFKFSVGVDGKNAETRYRVSNYYKAKVDIGGEKAYQQGFTELELYPKTGRTHQLRVHLKHMKHPLVADKLYLGKKSFGKDSGWCSRHFLHAKTIEFKHPGLNKSVDFEAKLPADLIEAKENLVKR